MAKVSASTLVRRARKTKDKAAAKRLRAMAAKARREARAKKARGNVAGEVTRLDVDRAVSAIRRARQEGQAAQGGPMVMQHDAAGGWREIGHDNSLISPETIASLRSSAKKQAHPDKPDLFAIRVRGALVDARVAGKAEAEDEALRRIKANLEAQSIAVVCAFLAEIRGIAALNGGALPPAIMIAGYTLARVTDALRAAGYTENGKEGKRPQGYNN